MKKTIAIFVLTLFLISLVPVFAEEDNQLIKQGNELIKEKREEIKTKINEIKNKLVEIKENYKTQKENLKDKIGEIKKECGDKANKTNCDKIKQEFFADNVKPHLLNSINLMRDSISKRQETLDLELTKAGNNTEDLNAALEELDAALIGLDDLEAQVQNATTKDQIKEITKVVKDQWSEVRTSLEKSRGNILNHRFAFAIEKSESLEKKLESILTKMESNGQDITLIQSKVDSFKEHIAKAKELSDQAKAKFADAITGDKETTVKEAHKLLTQAQEEFKAAHNDLKDIVSGMKKAKVPETELEGNETVEA